MSLELTKEDLIEAAARGFERALCTPDNRALLAEAITASVVQHFELVPPTVAASILDKAEITLQRNHVEWGLDKSVAFGRETPLYFLSQILARAKAKVIAGRAAGNVTEFPSRRAG